jgi:8-oxo-dGTP pyrophosphatase MutT (NUDIX family)
VKAVLVCGDKVLFVHHSYGPDRWELPGGGIHRHEEPLAALRRELDEELGVRVDSAAPLSVSSGPGRFRNHHTHLYRVDLGSPTVAIDPVEILEARWCDPAAPPGRLGPLVREALRSAAVAVS